MPETQWTLKTPDKKTIYGVKNSAGKKAQAAIFMMHGLTGHMYEYHLKRAADYFAAKGFDVYRFNLYDGETNARRLVDCTIRTHADDLNTVLQKFAPGYKKVFLIGHSFGGTTVMLAQPKNITAASLWDPSFDLPAKEERFSSTYHKQTGLYSLDWGCTFLIGPAMVEESKTLDEAACIQLAQSFGHPVQVVFAGDGDKIKEPYSYHSFGHPKNRRDVVKGTVHCFYEGTACDELLKTTHTWFRQWL